MIDTFRSILELEKCLCTLNIFLLGVNPRAVHNKCIKFTSSPRMVNNFKTDFLLVLPLLRVPQCLLNF